MIECAHERKNNMFGSSSKLDVESTGKIFIFITRQVPTGAYNLLYIYILIYL